ncbi:MOSC domain-containing protein [Nocardioides sp. zg-579]|uniref:MOSC domain-containing protein n=1 Tax=Nocardioides marmotae TaxID=2663857 RepID=A0A6I3JDQ9_9ACTN|nr:MOSC N-terminal beta barrel domain-containing protein [Nocardioides marmotae]MCR6032574.1 MOSC domain-containing protein [Gordonia jinghuaiqii]MTB96222.1 MOSC domain-containing protein [Nocardioides marmotae]QKD99708.1 MOSC domain-containing protein [Nocardioides marmotae]
MRVVEVRRYPVKSLRGESLERADVEARGVVGDRWWALREPDGKLGSGKSTRRFRKMAGLLELAATYDGDVPVVTLPDGSTWRAPDPALDEALTAYVGRPVALRQESDVEHHDEGPLHLVTTATLDRLGADGALLRANLVVDVPGIQPFAEDLWAGRELRFEDGPVLVVREPMPRCVMVGSAVLHEATRLNDGSAGVVVDVVSGGPVAIGQHVVLGDRAPAR